ncbi:glycerophosphoryl diester phosphodiesterase, partial [Natronorubrum bangense JCM 10635]
TVDDIRTLHELGVDGVTADRWDIAPPALEPTVTTRR